MYEVAEEGREQYEAWLEGLPVHQPIAPEAPIPGRHWYGGCSPDYDRVGPDGKCLGCGEKACPKCGCGFYADGGCGCPDVDAETELIESIELGHEEGAL